MESKMPVIGTHYMTPTDDLYLLVDFLNRNLKDKDIVFGLAKSKEEEGRMVLTLYRSSL